MDLMRLLRSFEEFLFEAITWLIFYPMTLWRIVTRPLATMAYSDEQQRKAEEERYGAAMPPPLLLLLSILLVNTFVGTLSLSKDMAEVHLGRPLFGSVQYLALFRALVFSLVPLIASATLLHHQRIVISRETLRPPFYAQCYLASPCCIAFGLGYAMVSRFGASEIVRAVGILILIAGAFWSIATQVRWFRAELRVSWSVAFWCCVQTMVSAVIALVAILTPVVLL